MEFVTVLDAAKRLGLSSSQIRKIIAKGMLTPWDVSKDQVTYKRGMPMRLTGIKTEDLELFIKSRNDTIASNYVKSHHIES
jgi:hypothetical protein